MIQPNELRIGNYVEYFGFLVKVNSIKKDNQYYISAKNFNTDYYNVIDSFKPIPLTEEILLNCGFEKNEEYDEGGLSDYYLEYYYDNEVILKSLWKTEGINSVNFPYLSKDIYYLHTLQNLIFALTNQELEINL